MDTTQELTLRLPAELVDRVLQAATRRHQPPDLVVAEILGISLPSLSARAEPPLQPLIKKLEAQPDEELRRKAQAWLPEEDQSRLTELLAQNRDRPLTSSEGAELEALLDKVEEVASEKAAATWLLLARGGEPTQ